MSALEEHIVELDKFVYGGDAMGRLEDGRAVFVPFGLPGEKVLIKLVLEKRGFARGKIVEIIEASPLRIKATCKHFSECGICRYQHLTYEEQLKAKEGVLIDQLVRLGGLEDPKLDRMVPSEGEWNYRNQVEFQQSPSGKFGYRYVGSKQVMSVEECFLPKPALNEFWPELAFEPLSDLTNLKLSLGKNDDLMMVLNSKKDEAFELEVDFPIKIIQVGPESVHVMADTYFLEHKVLGKNFRVSAISSFRANTQVIEKMVEFLIAELDLTPETTLIEAYCGVGMFSSFLAPRVGRLIGIESNPAAAKDFVKNLEEFENVEIYEDLAEFVLPELDFQTDILLVDPPKAGLGPKVLDAILKLSPKVLAYVSSDPATLARDAKRLGLGEYALYKIAAFDLLPQTMHIDSISIWKKG